MATKDKCTPYVPPTHPLRAPKHPLCTPYAPPTCPTCPYVPPTHPLHAPYAPHVPLMPPRINSDEALKF